MADPNPTTIPRTMWAAQLIEYNKPYHLTTQPTPTIRPNELLVKIAAAGFCHSDLQVWKGELSSPLPLIPSHEPVGTVVQVGNEVSKWKVGDRVGVLNFKNACSKCPSCLSTFKRYGSLDPRYCENREAGGFMTDGAFAEYMVADSATTVTLPPGISFEQGAPLLCAGATVWGALQKAIPSLQPDDTIGIIGIGGLGQLGVQFSKALNYRTVAMDNHEPSLDLTVDLPSDLQPDLRVNSADADAADRIHAYTRGEGLAAVIVCTDSIAVNKWALGLLRVGGVLVPLGLPVENWEFDSRLLLFRELVIRGSYVASKGEVEEMVELVEKREIKSMVTVVQKGDIPRLPERYMSREFRGRLVVTF